MTGQIGAFFRNLAHRPFGRTCRPRQEQSAVWGFRLLFCRRCFSGPKIGLRLCGGGHFRDLPTFWTPFLAGFVQASGGCLFCFVATRAAPVRLPVMDFYSLLFISYESSYCEAKTIQSPPQVFALPAISPAAPTANCRFTLLPPLPPPPPLISPSKSDPFNFSRTPSNVFLPLPTLFQTPLSV